MSNTLKSVVLWVLKLVPVVILLQTVFLFKFANSFTGHEESVALFQKLSDFLNGMIPENAFRLGTGVAEVIASILLIIPVTARKGAIFTLLIMGGAILSHILVLGIDPVFGMAVIVTFSCLAYLVLSKKWDKL